MRRFYVDAVRQCAERRDHPSRSRRSLDAGAEKEGVPRDRLPDRGAAPGGAATGAGDAAEDAAVPGDAGHLVRAGYLEVPDERAALRRETAGQPRELCRSRRATDAARP